MSQENYTPKPYAERASQKVGVWDYCKKQLGLLLIPIAAGATGWFAGKSQKVAPDFYETSLDGGKGSLLQRYLHVMQRGSQTYFGNPDHKGPTYLFIGAKIGLVVMAFLFWKQKEKKRLEIGDTVGEVKDIAHLHRTDEDLAKDNKLVEKMITHERKKQAVLTEKLPENFRDRATEPATPEASPQR